MSRYAFFNRKQFDTSLSMLFLLSLVTMLQSCGSGGSSDDATEQDSTTTFEPGVLPRQVLQVAAAGGTTLSVESHARQTIDVAGDIQSDFADASYELGIGVSGKAASPTATLQVSKVLFATSLETPPALTQPGVTRQFFAPNGRMLTQQRYDRNVPNGVLDAATLDVFLLPAAFLEVPEEPIGVGAIWTLLSDSNGLNTRVTTVVLDMGEDSITVEREISLADGQGTFQALEGNVTATHELSSLLLREADIRMRLSFSTTLPVNGQEQEVYGTVEHSRIITQAAN